MIKRFYIAFVSLLVTHLSLPIKVRDLFMWPLASRILGTSYTAPLVLAAGFTINAFMEDQLGRLAMFYGTRRRYFWEPSTMQLLEKLLPNAREAIIAGSHIGLTVLYARNAMKHESARVHTFEPIVHLYEVSQNNFLSNPLLSGIVLNHSALGNTEGFVTMTQDRIRSRIIDGKAYKNLETEQVPITTIDSYCEKNSIQQLDVVLLDIEGYEYNALSGMQNVLAHTPPKDIIYEISFPKKDNLEAAQKIESLLRVYGYTCYIIEDSADPEEIEIKTLVLTLASKETYAEHMEHRYFNMYATRRTAYEVESLLI